jgi:hypothetical protein
LDVVGHESREQQRLRCSSQGKSRCAHTTLYTSRVDKKTQLAESTFMGL